MKRLDAGLEVAREPIRTRVYVTTNAHSRTPVSTLVYLPVWGQVWGQVYEPIKQNLK